MTDLLPHLQIIYCKSVTYISSTDIHQEICWKRSLADSINVDDRAVSDEKYEL